MEWGAAALKKAAPRPHGPCPTQSPRVQLAYVLRSIYVDRVVYVNLFVRVPRQDTSSLRTVCPMLFLSPRLRRDLVHLS